MNHSLPVTVLCVWTLNASHAAGHGASFVYECTWEYYELKPICSRQCVVFKP